MTMSTRQFDPDRPSPMFLKQEAICRELGISRSAWYKARAAGTAPQPDLHIGRSPRWSRETLLRGSPPAEPAARSPSPMTGESSREAFPGPPC
jgi:predicted DNA-binding transcriptional regulator AlpA